MNATAATEIHIAAATPADVPVIHTLIRELAAFERLLDEAKATEEQLHEGLFGARPSAEVIIARVGGEVAGAPVNHPLDSIQTISIGRMTRREAIE